MELGNSGSLMNFALQIEESAMKLYKNQSKNQEAGLFDQLSRKCSKRVSRIERMQREGVVELSLEPITGLYQENYQFTQSAESKADALQVALNLAGIRQHFYRDAAEKVPIREYQRLFARLKNEIDDEILQLESAIS